MRINYLAGQDTWALGVFVDGGFAGCIGFEYTADRFGNAKAGDAVYITAGIAQPTDVVDQRPAIVDDRYLDILRGEAMAIVPADAELIAIPSDAWNYAMMAAGMGETLVGRTVDEMVNGIFEE